MGCAGSLMAEMKQNLHCGRVGLLKQAATLDIASPDTCQCLKRLFVTSSRGLIADLNSTHLESRNLTCEFGTTLNLGPNICIPNKPLLFGVI